MNYHDIVKDDMLNGEGLRVTLFVAGCSHYCKNCQNPETWDKNSGIKFDADAVKEIEEELNKEYISGITLSGGDPLFIENRETITELCKYIKNKYPDKTIWVYTGYKYEEISDLEIMNYIDILVDGEYQDDKHDIELKWCGSTNQRIIDIKSTLKSGEIILYKD